jgi:hypothetical protein
MGERSAPASSRGHSLLGLAAPALCIAGLLFAPGRAYGEFRLFDPGAGIDFLSELQKSLTISSSTGTVTVLDREDGSTVTGPLDGDPRLLNRKFDVEWSMNGPGIRLPLSLAPWSIGGAEIRPTLTFEALNGDFDLRFLNQRETAPDDALHGRGPMYGVELSVGSEFPGSPWFAEGGYRFHSLPSTDADRSQPFFSQGARVLSDETRLSRETHDVFSHVGYKFSEALRSYTGVRYRRADVEIEDDLRFADTLLRETTLSSRTKLDGSATEAIVGVEARRGSFIGRTEITFNDEDYGVLATVTYRRPNRHSPDFAALAASAAPLLAELEAEFRERRKELTVVTTGEGETAYLTAEVEGLLGWTEGRLFEILNARELAPLRDSIRLRFYRFRGQLDLIQRVGERKPGSESRPEIAFASYRLAQDGPGTILPDKKVVPILDAAVNLLRKLTGLANEGRFTLRLCIDSPLLQKADFRMWPPEFKKGKHPTGQTAFPIDKAVLGRYFYSLEHRSSSGARRFFECSEDKDKDEVKECLDLLEKSADQLVTCNFQKEKCELHDLGPKEKCPP